MDDLLLCLFYFIYWEEAHAEKSSIEKKNTTKEDPRPSVMHCRDERRGLRNILLQRLWLKELYKLSPVQLAASYSQSCGPRRAGILSSLAEAASLVALVRHVHIQHIFTSPFHSLVRSVAVKSVNSTACFLTQLATMRTGAAARCCYRRQDLLFTHTSLTGTATPLTTTSNTKL